MARPKSGYRLQDGTKIVGVTTVIGRFKETGGLLYWAFEQGKSAERGEISKLYDKRDDAANFGEQVHNLVEAHISGQPITNRSTLVPEVLQGFENYLNWEVDNKIVIDQQEIPLVSEKYRFGGTLDAIGHDSRGRRILLDWKTSNSVYVDYLLQLSAYQALWEENYPDDPIGGGLHLCRFSKDYGDFAHHYFSELDDAWEQFKLFLKAFRLDKLIKRRC